MQTTIRNLITQRVADADRAGAKAWLARRLAWEQRLRDLEDHRGAPTAPAEVPYGGRRRAAARRPVTVAQAS